MKHARTSGPRTRKATDARSAIALESIPNVGKSIAQDLRLIGIKNPGDLIGRDPQALYEALCARTRARHDPCVLDTFISAVRFMEGAPAKPWWHYTPERKAALLQSAPPRKVHRREKPSPARSR